MLPMLRTIARRCRGLVSRAPQPEFDEEIELHLRLLTDRFIGQGLAPDEAAAAARRQFGNIVRQREDRHDLMTIAPVERAWRAVRYAVRQLRHSPVFTATAILSLALGIGANTAVFTLLDQLVLRLLPVRDPGRLVMIWSTGPNLGSTRGPRTSSFPLCQEYQRRAVALDAVFCRAMLEAAVTVGSATEVVRAELVSGNYFEALGVVPAAGRVFSTAADDRVDRGHPVVVLAHGYWVDRFGGRPDVVGRTLLVNRQPMEIVGVAAAGFHGLDAAESPQIWLPVRMTALLTTGEDGLNDRAYHFLQLFGRLKAGHTVESARASLQPVFREMLEAEVQEPEIARNSAYDRDRFLRRTVLMERAATGYSELRERYATALTVLMGMAGLILLIACSNVAGLLVARGLARRREMALRLSIGAGRGALVSQLLVESLLLSAAGALLGLLLSVVATRALLAMLPPSNATLLLSPEPDGRILLFAIGVSLATGVLFGLLPAMQATKVDLGAALKASGSVVGGTGSARLRKVLVAGQVALSFLLLTGAGLFARTLANLNGAPSGLRDIDNLVTFELDPALNGYDVPRIHQLYRDVVADVSAQPGVTAVAYTWIPLLQGWAPSFDMRIEGYAAADGEDMEVSSNVVSPGYWSLMGISLLEGRDFDETDRLDPADGERLPTVAIVNRAFARRFFNNRSVVGRRIGMGDRSEALEIRIVGVVEDALYAGPRAGVQPQVYFSFLQLTYPAAATFYVRAAVEPTGLFPALRDLLARRDPRLPIDGMKTLDRQRDETLSAERLIASLALVFAGLATVMSALGLYGVMAFSVERRFREIGLRTALGAPPGRVRWMILREALVLIAIGVAVGLPCALLAGQFAASQLFGVTPADYSVHAIAAVVLAAVAISAGFFPARRAASVDPLAALRCE